LAWCLGLFVARADFDALLPKNAVADSMMPPAGRGLDVATGLFLCGWNAATNEVDSLTLLTRRDGG
jgi:hypothetical protein